MHITIQPISIWTKHQSAIIKPKTEPIGKHTLQWLRYLANTPQDQCSGTKISALGPTDVGRPNTIPYKIKNHVRTSMSDQHSVNHNELTSPKRGWGSNSAVAGEGQTVQWPARVERWRHQQSRTQFLTNQKPMRKPSSDNNGKKKNELNSTKRR